MNENKNVLAELQRYYALWKDSTAMYEEWSKDQGLSSNGVLLLYSFHEEDGFCTQKMLSEKWCIPKQTVNTILKDFEKKGYVEMVSMPDDKRNKRICLTEEGKLYAADIVTKLHEKESYVISQMGIGNIKSMNDNTELFIKLFREGGTGKDES